jgi:hypothetical protein
VLAGVVMIVAGLLLLAIARDASETIGEIESFIQEDRARRFPRFAKLFRGYARQTPKVSYWGGSLVGLIGVVGGAVLVVREL